MSAPASLSLSALRFAASTGAWIVRPWMPAGRDQLVQVVGDGADETDLDVAEVLDPGLGRAAEPSSAWRTLAPR